MCTRERVALLAFAYAIYPLWTQRKTKTPLQILIRGTIGTHMMQLRCRDLADCFSGLALLYFMDGRSLIVACLSNRRTVSHENFTIQPLESNHLWSLLLILLGVVIGIGFHALFYKICQCWTSTNPRTDIGHLSEPIDVNVRTNPPRTTAQLPARQDRGAKQANAPEIVGRGLDRTLNPGQGVNLAQRSPEIKQEFPPVAIANASRRRATRQGFKKAQSEPASRELPDFSPTTSGLLTPSATP